MKLEYLLNPRERNKIRLALTAYNADRNIGAFVEAIDRILDTPAKRTLWFHVIPLLDEDDQEYTKRKLLLFTSRELATHESSSGFTNEPFLLHNNQPSSDYVDEGLNERSWTKMTRSKPNRDNWEINDNLSQHISNGIIIINVFNEINLCYMIVVIL